MEETNSIDTGMTLTLEQEIFADLQAELSLTDKNFNEVLLLSKIHNALREVKRARSYPESYTDEMINADMYEYYSNVRNLALYDYNTIGADFESSHNENSISRSYTDRNKLFCGVVPFAKI
jgi:hypothetical protein